MRVSKIICFIVGAMLAAAAACADEISIVSNLLGPEGPLYVEGNLYYVGWVSNTLSKWNGKTTTVLNHTQGCDHNVLALMIQNTFLLACTEDFFFSSRRRHTRCYRDEFRRVLFRSRVIGFAQNLHDGAHLRHTVSIANVS